MTTAAPFARGRKALTAHLLTWRAVEARAELDKQYMSMPANRSPVTYPLDPKKMAQTTIPLHSGALRYYQEAGYL